MDQDSRERLQQQFKITNYIGLAMMATVFIYAGVVLAMEWGYIPLNQPRQTDMSVFSILKYLLLLISLIFYGIIKLLQKLLPRLLLKQSTMPAAGVLASVAIITWALCEAVAIYGLVLFILTRNPTDFFIFMFISLLYFYLFYPKYAEWEEFLEQAQAASQKAN